MRLVVRFIVIAMVLAASTITHADSILVGTNLATISGGSGLCPSGSDCEVLAQQFTLISPVVIDHIQVAIGGPNLTIGRPGGGTASTPFFLRLGNQLGTGVGAGSNTLTYPFGGPTVTQVFDFTGLNIALTPGTYYLEVSGGNLEWAFAEPLTTSTGTVGSTFMCDPTVRPCSVSSNWQNVAGTHAFEIDGTTPVPEPSSWLLLGTGALVLLRVSRLKSVGVLGKVG